MDFLEFRELGISCLPLDFNKRPVIPSWKKFQTELPSEEECKGWGLKGYNIGLVCGAISGNLFVLDIDEKANVVGDQPLIEQWRDNLNVINPDILNKVLLAKTVNKGWHILYRCEETLGGNEKFASRYPTPSEAEEGVRSVTLLESRCNGGYVVEYQLLKGSWDNVPVLTLEEHRSVVNAAKLINRMVKANPVTKGASRGISGGLTVQEDYDQQTDVSIVLDWLLNEGWSIARDFGDSWHLWRPGKYKDSISASLNVIPGVLYVFSTSTDFEVEKPYSPFQVYSHLNNNDDWSVTALELSKEGYGSPMELSEKEELKSKLLQSETLEITDEEEERILSRVSTVEDSMDQYLEYASVARNFILEPHLSHLEKLMKDIQRGHYVAWAGASGGGKTTTAFQAGISSLRRTDQYGVRISLELANRDVALRDAMELSDPHEGNYVDKDIVTKELFSNEEFRERVKEYWGRFYVIDSIYDVELGFQTVSVLKRKLKREGKELGLVIWDFAQMADGGFEIDKQPKIAQAFKMWSKKLDVTTIALLQLNASIDKYTEPNENNISGSKMFFQTADHAFMVWKNRLRKNRIIIKSAKERWSLEGRCDLVQTGMKIHSEKHEPLSAKDIAEDQGNSKDVF